MTAFCRICFRGCMGKITKCDELIVLIVKCHLKSSRCTGECSDEVVKFSLMHPHRLTSGSSRSEVLHVVRPEELDRYRLR